MAQRRAGTPRGVPAPAAAPWSGYRLCVVVLCSVFLSRPASPSRPRRPHRRLVAAAAVTLFLRDGRGSRSRRGVRGEGDGGSVRFATPLDVPVGQELQPVRRNPVLMRGVRMAALAAVLVSLAAVAPAHGDVTCEATPAAARPGTVVSPEVCDVLQPGQNIDFPVDFQLVGRNVERNPWGCTAGFMFRDSRGRRYMGTAAHCYFRPGTLFVAHGDDRGALVYRNGDIVGAFVYADYRQGRDFALFRLYPEVAARPALTYWGGPTHLHRERASTPVLVRHSGVGLTFKDAAQHRTSVVAGTQHAAVVQGVGPISAGDSGSPVMTAAGGALSYVTSYGSPVGSPSGVDVTWTGPRLDAALRAAETALGFPLTLMTAPLAR